MPTHIPAPGDLYRSRDGRYLMRVLRLSDQRVYCVHVDKRRHAWRFDLPLAFFSSPACGWHLADAEPLATRVQ